MKQMLSLLLVCLLLTGCGIQKAAESTVPAAPSVTAVTLSDDGILVNGGKETSSVFTTHDIIYYEDREHYESGNPYGEGTPEERHSAEEAAAHTVVNITQPGTYRVSGKLSKGQIRIDLGEDTRKNPDAVVDLILADADITCTVAPAILFRNVYECDGDRDEENATATVDTSTAGANLILEGSNKVSGSHVAKIFKDKDGEKKLWKQDGAIYSYMSMNIGGNGSLELTADNEGMGTEMHLTINGGDISIYSDNDGINTNEDNVSVTTVNAGNLTIHAGLGKEGDGIDSNGYLVINGGTVVSCAKPVSDAGLDSDKGSFINGGTVIAMGSTMDWAENESQQVTMNLQFASQQAAGSKITITKEDGTDVFSFDTAGEYARGFSGLILSHAAFRQGETYLVYIDGLQMAYTGTDVGRGPGGFGGRPGGLPEGFEPGQMPEDFETPENFDPSQMFGGEMPEDFDPSQMGGPGHRPNGGDCQPPAGFEGKDRPEGLEPGQMPEGFDPSQFGSRGESAGTGEVQTGFYMNDKVNAFSGVTVA